MKKKIKIISIFMIITMILSITPVPRSVRSVYASEKKMRVSDLNTPDIADRVYYSNDSNSTYGTIAAYAVENLKNANGVIDVSSYNIQVSEVEKLVDAIYNEDLCLYNSINIQGYKYSYSGDKLVSLTIYFDDAKSEIQDKYSKLQTALKNAKIELNIDTNTMSQVEIALKIHDYLALNSEYDYDTLKANGEVSAESHSAYGILVDKIGVCDGYSNAYKMLLKEYGINSIVVTSTSMCHAWNMIEIDGKYYHTDVTWDDPIINEQDLNGYVSHAYFMKNDSEFLSLEHYSWNSLELTATSTKYSSWFVSDINNELCYLNGYWYYPKDGEIIKSNIDETDSSVIKDTGNSYTKVGVYNNKVYYSLGNYLYSCDGDGNNIKTEYIITKVYDGIDGNQIYSMYITPRGMFKFSLIYSTTILNDEVSIYSSGDITLPNGDDTDDGITVSYRTHVQDIGWMDYVTDGSTSGTTGQNKKIEAINISVSGDADLGVSYSTHVQDIGWMNYVNDNETSGTTGQNKRIEAIKIKLTGNDKDNYDIYYRVHAESYGWLGWAKNDEPAGTSGYGKRLEAIEIIVVNKGGNAPTQAGNAYIIKNTGIQYRTHVQNIGWMNYVSNGALSGTTGESKRLEAINIKVTGNSDLGVSYSTHVQDIGWMNYVSNGALSGTSGQGKRLEAIKIKLTGNDKDKYDIYYRVHAESYGWLGWAKNDQPAGTSGYGKRLEAIEIVIVNKGASAPGSTNGSYVAKNNIGIQYRTHVQNIGWMNYVSNGTLSGTTGQSKRLEAINIKITGNSDLGVSYSTHVQDIGWMNYVSNGALSGTSGQGKRLEAIKIKLTGNDKDKYDIYYRVHAESFGWLGWAKNDQPAGTQGYGKRLEAIEIVIVAKGSNFNGSTTRYFVKK